MIDRGIAEHGPIFRTNILGHDTAVISGPDAAELFIREDLVLRSGATPKHVQELLSARGARRAFVALAAIAWADGHVSESESTALVEAASASGVGGAELDAERSAAEQPSALSQ